MPEPAPRDPVEPIDPDIDLHIPAQRIELARREWDILLAVAIGGVVGAEARYGLSRLIVDDAHAWPWSTLLVNVLGSAALGVLMGVLGAQATPLRLVRPFVGVGVLGGFTTFSTFALDGYHLLAAHRPFVALGYVVASVLGCVLACALGGGATTRLVRRARAGGRP